MAEQPRSLKEVGKRLGSFFINLLVLVFLIGSIVLVMTLKAYFPDVPIPTIVLLLVSIGAYVYTFYLIFAKKAPWPGWIILLLCLGLAGYFMWSYWGIVAGIGIWIGLLLFASLMVNVFSPRKTNGDSGNSGRSDQISSMLEVKGPDGKTGWIDLSKLFHRAEQVQDTEALRVQGEAALSVTQLMRELRKWTESGFIDSKALHAAAKKLGISHLLEVDEAPSDEGISENFWNELEEMNDFPS